jgi:hypothetical protein
MEDIFINGTIKTPEVNFNHLSGELNLHGRSYPENGGKVYDPLLDWVNEYIKSPQKTTNLHLNLEYFNSTTLLWISKIIKSLGKIDQKGASLYIHLYFDIDDLESRDIAELKDITSSFFDNKGSSDLTISIITHKIDNAGKDIIESTTLI